MSQFFLRLLAVGAATCAVSSPVFAENLTPDLQFNGFATMGAAWVSGAKSGQYLNNGIGRSGIQSDPTLDYDSVVGLQFSYKVNDKTDLVTQLVAKGRTSDDGSVAPWAIGADWAYIAYHLTDELTLRAGRFNFDTYMYSENQRVGQAYPWARLPTEVYSTIPLENYDGADVLYRHPFGDWALTLQPFVGSYHDNNLNVNRMRGVNANLSNDSLTFHIGTSESDVDYNFGGASTLGAAAVMSGISPTDPSVTALLPVINSKNNRSSYVDAGALYDDGDWFLATEFSTLRNKGWAQDYNSGYASVGHYFGDWLPYVVYSRIKTINNQETVDAFAPIGEAMATLLRQSQQTTAVGVRYQLYPNTSIKAQVDRISGFDGTKGLFGDFTNPAETFQLSTAYLYSLSLNVAF